MIIVDGLGDRPTSIFAGATPLEAAHTPNLDRLVTHGLCGQMDPFIPGLPVSTHTGTGLLMGLAPKDAYQLARGPIEAMGIDMPMQLGDVSLRANFATLEREGEGLKILDRRAGRIQQDAQELAAVLQNVGLDHGITAAVQPATQHRAVLRLSGPRLSAAISDTDPGDVACLAHVLTSHPLDENESSASNTAEAVNAFVQEAFERLREHPVNQQRRTSGLLPATGIITRGAGMLCNVDNLLDHLQIRVAVVASESTILGLTKLFQFTAITDSRFTALPNTDLKAKVDAACAALKENDLVFLHVKGVDSCGHDKDPQGKKTMIERIDDAIVSLPDDELVIGVCADHCTDSSIGCHSGDPVPVILWATHGRRDACRSYGETECMRGGLGRISATTFLLSLLDLMTRLENYRVTDLPFLRSGP